MKSGAGGIDPASPSTAGVEAENERDSKSTLRVIAGFKFFEAALLILGGLGALGLLQTDVQHALVGWLDELTLRAGRRLTSEFASKLLDTLGTTTIARLMLIAIGCFVYAGVFIIEGTGLWLRKRWAEYLTTIVTASLLPFELMELMHGPSAAKVLTLVINLLVLGYLVWVLVTHRAKR